MKQGENAALTIPLCVTGSAAELDAEFVSQISSFVASHVGLNTNLAAIEKEIAEAEKAAREEARKKHKVVGNSGKKSADSTPATPPASAKPELEHPQMLSLFDQQAQATASEPAKAPQHSDVQAS